MTKDQFKRSFYRGLGSAIIELEQCSDKSRYRDAILYGCIHNTTYDMQSEGDRAFYLHRAIKLYGDVDLFEDSIITRFESVRLDLWLFNQLASLLCLFAKDGSEKACKALNDKYDILLKKTEKMRKPPSTCDISDMFEWLSVWMTELNGFSAFKKIVFDYGHNIIKGKAEYYSSDWFYANSQNKFGKKRVEKYLLSQADKSPEVKAFYESSNIITDQINVSIPRPTLEEVIENAYGIQEGNDYLRHRTAMLFARNASESDLKKLYEVALQERNINIKSELLWAFRKVKFDFSEEILNDLAHSESEDIRDTAFYVMLQSSSLKMHDLALSIISDEKELENGIMLLCRNFKLKDEMLLYNAIKRVKINKNSSWHGAYMAIELAFEKGHWKPRTDILLFVYENTLCSFCRLGIVKLMNQHKVLTKGILDECFLDSNADIRVFAEAKLKKWK